MSILYVSEIEPGPPRIWKLRWEDGEKRIENVFEADEKPEVRETWTIEGNVVLRDQHGKEVGRYNNVWRGSEFTCEETGAMMGDPNAS